MPRGGRRPGAGRPHGVKVSRERPEEDQAPLPLFGEPPSMFANLRPGDVRSFARQILEDPVYRENTYRRAVDGALSSAIESTLYHYAYGKPVDMVVDEHADAQLAEDLMGAIMRHAVDPSEAQKNVKEIVEKHRLARPYLGLVRSTG